MNGDLASNEARRCGCLLSLKSETLKSDIISIINNPNAKISDLKSVAFFDRKKLLILADHSLSYLIKTDLASSFLFSLIKVNYLVNYY